LTAVVVVGAKFTTSAAVCPGATVVDPAIPVAVTPVPLGVTEEIVTFELPVLVIVTFCEGELPIFTLPKLTLAGLAPSVNVAAVPVPLREIVAGDPGALLAIDTVPVAPPAAVGANFALNVSVCPAATVVFAFSPETLNPVPVTVALVIVRVDWPVFVIVMFCEFELPVMTLPKFRLVVDKPKPACAPVPVKLSTVGEPWTSLAIETLPATAPAVVGANLTDKVADVPGLSVEGAATPLAVKPAPVVVIPEICTAAWPVLVNVEVRVLLLPTLTFPKLRLPGAAPSWPTACVVPVPLTAMVTGEFGALLVIETLPDIAPVTVGE
jgi:hypothetical protein